MKELAIIKIKQSGPKAYNQAIKKHGPAKYYALIEEEMALKPDTLQKLTNYLKANPKIAVVAPQLRYKNQGVEDNYRSFPRILDLIIKRIPFLRKKFPQRMRSYLMWDRDPGSNQAVDWVTKGFMIISHQAYQKIGGFDERYALFMADLSFCRETWKHNYEVHILGDAECLHQVNPQASAGLKDIFRKQILRTHIKDAIKYFWHYKFQKLPKSAPSINIFEKKERLMKAYQISKKPHLTNIGKKLQKENPVVSVYQANVEGPFSYQQPIIFFNDGTISIIKNSENKYGLIKIWRHTPLKENVRNSFPIFPDTSNLGTWSWEAVRGGIEKCDKNQPLESAKRELQEEINLKPKDIQSTKEMGKIISNTAIDIYRHYVYQFDLKGPKIDSALEEKEGIIDLQFFSKEEIKTMIANKEIICGLTQAALLQSIL